MKLLSERDKSKVHDVPISGEAEGNEGGRSLVHSGEGVRPLKQICQKGRGGNSYFLAVFWAAGPLGKGLGRGNGRGAEGELITCILLGPFGLLEKKGKRGEIRETGRVRLRDLHTATERKEEKGKHFCGDWLLDALGKEKDVGLGKGKNFKSEKHKDVQEREEKTRRGIGKKSQERQHAKVRTRPGASRHDYSHRRRKILPFDSERGFQENLRKTKKQAIITWTSQLQFSSENAKKKGKGKKHLPCCWPGPKKKGRKPRSSTARTRGEWTSREESCKKRSSDIAEKKAVTAKRVAGGSFEPPLHKRGGGAGECVKGSS